MIVCMREYLIFKLPDIQTPNSKLLPTMAHVDDEYDLRYYHRYPFKQDVSHNNDRNTKVALFLALNIQKLLYYVL